MAVSTAHYGDTDRLAKLIADKHACLVQLRDLGARQTELIHEGNLTALLRMFADKQRLLDDLLHLERQLDPYRDEEPELRVWKSADVRRRVSELVDQSQRLLDEILRQEQDGEAELRTRRDQVSARLQSLQVAGDAHQAYAADQNSRDRGLDLSS